MRQLFKSVSTLRWLFPSSIMAFQEVPAWTSADRTVVAGGRYEMFTPIGSECGFALPTSLAENVAFVDSGRDWAVVLSGPLLFCTLHYIRWEPERAATSLAALSAAIQYAKDHINSNATVIYAADLNTTLVQDSEGLVGPYLMQRPVSHTLTEAAKLGDFMSDFNLVAGNTHTLQDYNDLYTWHSRGKKSQIDYICYEATAVVGHVTPRTINRGPFRFSDHRVLVAEFSLLSNYKDSVGKIHVRTKEQTWVGLEPNSITEGIRYQENSLQLLNSGSRIVPRRSYYSSFRD